MSGYLIQQHQENETKTIYIIERVTPEISRQPSPVKPQKHVPSIVDESLIEIEPEVYVPNAKTVNKNNAHGYFKGYSKSKIRGRSDSAPKKTPTMSEKNRGALSKQKQEKTTPPTRNSQASVSSRPSRTPERACKKDVNYKTTAAEETNQVVSKRVKKQEDKEKLKKNKTSKDHCSPTKIASENPQPSECQVDGKEAPYFWPLHLHQEFMQQFSMYGKTWKIVSQKMAENGVRDKDQLQCRTHGQKYLLQIDEIKKNINQGSSNLAKDFDKKMYQKLQKYQEDRKYLYKMHLKGKEDKTRPLLLDF
jgi:hypothetical protein